MAYYENSGQVNDEAVSISGGKTFQVIQIADSDGNIINPASGQLVFDGEITIGSEIEISNDVGSPIPVSDAGGSLTIDSPSLGEPNSSAATTDTGTFGLISLFKRALQGITSILGYVDGVEGLLTTIDSDTGAIDGKLPALSSGRIPVDGSGVTQPVSASALPLPSGASTESTLSTLSGKVPSDLTVTSTRLLVDGSGVTQPVSGTVNTLTGLDIPKHDNIVLTYTGENLTSVAYRVGASTVATLTLAYTGSRLDSVTKS